jgi:hypothetical protein
MAKQLSFTKLEHEALHPFRQKLNNAESAEDVRNLFLYSINSLFENIFGDELSLGGEDITLLPEAEPCFRLSERVVSLERFSAVWADSDLSRVIERFAEPAVSHLKHLGKHPEKTDQKIRN